MLEMRAVPATNGLLADEALLEGAGAGAGADILNSARNEAFTEGKVVSAEEQRNNNYQYMNCKSTVRIDSACIFTCSRAY